MRRHHKSHFHITRNKRSNKIIATASYFANENAVEGYYCPQIFYGMTSRILLFAGMRTESEFPQIYLYFIRQYGILSALQIDNTKFEMIQFIQ
jgi:hypothetical protein